MPKPPPRALCALLFVFVGAAAGAAQPPAARAPVTVKVYAGSSADPSVRTDAVRMAAAIIADAGVETTWIDCSGDADRPSCRTAPPGRVLIIRVTPTLAAGTLVSTGSIQSRSDHDAAGLVLGFAVVDPLTGAGALATLFMDRIVAIAQRTATTRSTVLGRAIAHEVGHLLLGTHTHSASGLMREIWTDAELAQNDPRDWLFSPADRAAMAPSSAQRISSR